VTESLFQNWCTLNGVQPAPISPHLVARFVADIAPLGADKVWQAVQEVSRLHYTVGLADPTLGHPVATAMTEIAGIDAPRSWTNDQKARFKTLPLDVQRYILERDKQDNKALRKAQNDAAAAKRQKEAA
jgi:hypothetical protein